MDWAELFRLVKSAQEGDRQAFERLAHHFAHFIQTVIDQEMGANLRQRIEIADLMQETSLQTWESLPRFRGQTEEEFRAWLATIARHVVQGEGRRRHEVPLEGDLRATGPSPADLFRRNERFDRLQRALRSLSPDHQNVIRLVRLEGRPVKEVATMMGRTPNATSVLLLRALLKLRTAFGNTDSFHLPPRTLNEEQDHGREDNGR